MIARLASAEAGIEAAQRRLDALKPPDIKVAIGEVRDYVTKACLDMKSLFCQTYALTRAKRELAKHMTELVLTPKETPEGWTYEVTGDWKLLPDQKCVIWLVARDGIEPPTRGFSVRCSTS